MRNSRHSEDSRLYFDWLEIAAQDLLAAQLLTEAGQCLEVAAFHCQQGMEKAFKAYLIYTGRRCAVIRALNGSVRTAPI